MKLRFAVIAAGYFLTHLCSLQAQQTLVDWGHVWNYMHPINGALPVGSGPTNPHPTGTTPWFATEANFSASYTGPSFTTGNPGEYEAGSGAGPLGYDVIAGYGAAGSEVPAMATSLMTPVPTPRRTTYFRTTFTVPGGGPFNAPVLRFLIDDGAYFYLDGVLVATANIAAGVNDTYQSTAVGASNENLVRVVDLTLPAGTVADTATIVQPVPSLAPGVHTLAVSVHNTTGNSSDLGLAVKLLATDPNSCFITGAASNVTRNTNATPDDPSDDTISFTLNVTPSGPVSPAGWTITGPGGSAAVGKTGAYSADVPVTNIPIFEFAAGSLAVVVSDAADANCSATVNVAPQRIIASDDRAGTNLPIVTTGTIPATGWVFDDFARSMTMTNGGGGARKVVTSQVVNLPGSAAVGFSGTLEVVDSSSGTEAADSFVAYLVIDGDTANRINLIRRYDTQVLDGVLSDDELAPLAGTFTYALSHVIAGAANTVQIVIEGINDSGSETFNVRDLRLGTPPPTVQATPGAVTFNNQGTVNPDDDTFSAPVTIEAFNVGASPGWKSDANPSAGSYAAPQPVTFGPFPTNTAPRTVTIRDSLDPNLSSVFTLILPPTTFTVSAPANIVRNENGVGVADDTVSFSVDIAGTFGGPGWTTSTTGVTPVAGGFGTVNLTIAAPLPTGTLDVVFLDSSYPSATQTVPVAIPGRYVFGERNFGGAPVDLVSDIATAPAPQWVNDPALRTLTMTAGIATDSVVTSETLDLTAVGQVFFSALFRASETSVGSNFETIDKFKAELIYTVGGTPTTVNLIDSYDLGNGAPSTTGTGVNGPKDGYINGYQGAAGTDVVTQTVYANALADYNANRVRDEFNLGAAPGVDLIENSFPLAFTVPANADSVRLVVTGRGVAGSETFLLTGVLFSTSMGPLDSDGDGMTDAYEDANGLNKNNPNDKFTDLDGDGQSNFRESLAGTAANSATSVLKITAVTRTGASTLNVTWNSVSGKLYRIDISPTMVNGSWMDIGMNFPATGTQTMASVAVPGTPTNYFVRVRVAP